MRGDAERQANIMLAVTPDSFIPADHPIRRIKPIVDAALHRLSPLFDTMYATSGRPSIPPEHLLKPGYTDRSLRGRDAGLAESSAGVPASAGRCRSEQAQLGGAEGAVARVREACSGMLARASDPGRRCERASGRER